MRDTPDYYNPFAEYAARRYCTSVGNFIEEPHCAQDVWLLPQLYQPPIKIIESDDKMKNPTTASGGVSQGLGFSSGKHTTPMESPNRFKERGMFSEIKAELSSGLEYRLLDKDDLVWWRGSTRNRKNVIDNFRGRIGERLLSLVLQGFLGEIVMSTQRQGYSRTRGGIIKERRKREGKPFHKHVVQWNEQYLLKFDRRTTFVVLKKSTAGETLHYVKELHLQKCEIDGLASLYLRKNEPDSPEQKYLIVAEVNTTRGERIFPNSWDLKSRRPSGESIESRLFEPLHSLFPQYRLAYVLMGYEKAIFREKGTDDSVPDKFPILSRNCARIAERLAAENIIPLFIPIPHTVDCPLLAQQGYEALLKYRAIKYTKIGK